MEDTPGKSNYAIPFISLNGSLFFVTFNTRDELEALTLAQCISNKAPHLLTILTDEEPN